MGQMAEIYQRKNEPRVGVCEIVLAATDFWLHWKFAVQTKSVNRISNLPDSFVRLHSIYVF